MISKEVHENLKNASWIRRMFVEGSKLREQFGDENVYDFSLGNPYFEPPKSVTNKLREVVNADIEGAHRYMDNAGFKDVRQKVANAINRDIVKPLGFEHVLMTVGAAGGINVLLRTVLDAGDEVIIFAPYFAEYIFYIKNHNGVPVIIKTDERNFEPDLELFEKSITAKTRAVLVNSPNNPTGVIYSDETLKKLGEILTKKEEEFGREIYMISDEPYKALVYDGHVVPNIHNYFRHSIMVNSYSKSLGLAGERIGYIAINSQFEDAELFMSGLAFANRTLGFVNAPAIWQKVISDSLEESVDISQYQVRRDLLFKKLSELGFEMVEPKGAFYLFPKALEADDVAFVMEAKKFNILLVPGSGFGYPGYFRISYCVDLGMIERSLPAFEKLVAYYKNK
ncbi:MAG: pyridoxal phosphate-dependent aminotransferase [Firmicutes bacterium]|nr:pyridoxal phosphate-dependent aminotransferase [Bacillota bacterium]